MAESWWSSFVNLGGLAGVGSLGWQIYKTFQEHSRRPRLKCLEPAIFNAGNLFGGTDTYWFITLPIQNEGPKSAQACIARATAIPLSSQGSRREVNLHWADTPYPEGSMPAPVAIAAGGQWRLDVVFSRSGGPKGPGRWLASHRAVIGTFLDDAELGQGEYEIEIRITCEDGDPIEAILLLLSSHTWDDLRVAVQSPQAVKRARGRTAT
jgi:hypothetical protein